MFVVKLSAATAVGKIKNKRDENHFVTPLSCALIRANFTICTAIPAVVLIAGWAFLRGQNRILDVTFEKCQWFVNGLSVWCAITARVASKSVVQTLKFNLHGRIGSLLR